MMSKSIEIYRNIDRNIDRIYTDVDIDMYHSSQSIVCIRGPEKIKGQYADSYPVLSLLFTRDILL